MRLQFSFFPLLQQAELTRSSFQPPPNKCVSDVPEWAGGTGGEGCGARRGGKKDGLLQKATRWWVRMGARGPLSPPLTPLPPPPCVMVPRGRAPAHASPPAPAPAPPDAWRRPRPRPAPRLHSIYGTVGRRPSRSIIDLVFIYCGPLAPSATHANTKTEIN